MDITIQDKNIRPNVPNVINDWAINKPLFIDPVPPASVEEP